MRDHIANLDFENEQADLTDDLLIGAEAIAEALKWKTENGKWHRRRVYYLAEQSVIPIHKVRGLGICARKSALWRFFDALDRKAIERFEIQN